MLFTLESNYKLLKTTDFKNVHTFDDRVVYFSVLSTLQVIGTPGIK